MESNYQNCEMLEKTIMDVYTYTIIDPGSRSIDIISLTDIEVCETKLFQ